MARGGTQEAQAENDGRRVLEATIRKGVLAVSGSPTNLFGVDVRRLWDNCYRVNILTGVDIVSARIAASYFLTADERGAIVASEPAITKQF